MSERQRRARKLDERPPSLSMRWRLRWAWYALARLLRDFRYAQRIGPEGVKDTLRALELTRRALARDDAPRWLDGLDKERPPTLPEAVAALSLARDHLAAIDLVWQRRLTAAGLDPRWPGSDD